MKGGFIINNNISYGLGGNVLFDSFEYGQNFLILQNNTQLHKQLYYQLLRHFSNNGAINLYVAAKRNPSDTSFETRNIYFDKLNAEFLHKLKADIKKCAAEAHKRAKPLLLICDWAGANTTFAPPRRASRGERLMGKKEKAKSPQPQTTLLQTSSSRFSET